MKTRLFYTFILICISIQIFGQKPVVKNNPEYDDKPKHFGYTLGFNVMDFSFGRNYPTSSNVYADIAAKTIGFQVGMITDFRLGEYFDLRILPSFNFGQRNISFFENNTNTDLGKRIPDSMKFITTMKLESSMLDLPILIKYKAKRVNNYRPYFIAGGSVRYDLASKTKFDSDTKDFLLLKPFDVYAEMGFGIDYYLPYFKLSTELKLSLGLMNVLNPKMPDSTPDEQKFVKALNRLTSNIIMFSIHIE